jgi:hypothetical protein
VTSEPILVIAYNKPDLLSVSLDKLIFLTQGKVYVHLDGPQVNSRSQELYFECKLIIEKAASKNSRIISKVQPSNLGGQFGVLAAIDWFFQNETFGIILEEDIGFGDGIFEFVSCYKTEVTRGNAFALCFFNPGIGLKQDFLLSHWLPWGWATSSENWSSISADIRNPDLTVKRGRPGNPSSRFAVRRYLNSIIVKVKSGEVRTWDAQVHATILNHRFTSVFPSKSLTKHLGIRPEATHADLVDWWKHINVSEYETKNLVGLKDSNNKIFEKLWRMSRMALFSNAFHNFLLRFGGGK